MPQLLWKSHQKLDRAESTSAHPLLWISGSLAINWSLFKITIVNPLGKEHMNFQETKTKIYSVYIIPAVNTQNHSHDLIHKIKNEGGRKKKKQHQKENITGYVVTRSYFTEATARPWKYHDTPPKKWVVQGDTITVQTDHRNWQKYLQLLLVDKREP